MSGGGGAGPPRNEGGLHSIAPLALPGGAEGLPGGAEGRERGSPEALPAEPEGGDEHPLVRQAFQGEEESVKVVVKTDGQKADDAAVPVKLWDKMFVLAVASECLRESMPSGWRQSLASLREYFIRWWRRRVMQSWVTYWRKERASMRQPRGQPQKKRLRRMEPVMVDRRSPGMALASPHGGKMAFSYD